MMKDHALIALAFDKQVRIYVSQTTHLVEQARQLHQTWPTATAALGRLLTASAMMGLMYKKGERLTLRVKGDGPIGQMLVEANPEGDVRGEIQNPHVYLTFEGPSLKHKLDVGSAVGKGFLHVTKDLGMKDYFTSSSALQTGEIGDDFTYYFAMSEQVPSSVGLGVLVDVDQSVLASGGYILQLLPYTSETTVQRIEDIIGAIPPMSTLIHEGKTPEDIVSLLSDGTAVILDKRLLRYHCHCSKRGFARSLSALDRETLDTLINEDGKAEVECHFCHRKYVYSKTELLQIKSGREPQKKEV